MSITPTWHENPPWMDPTVSGWYSMVEGYSYVWYSLTPPVPISGYGVSCNVPITGIPFGGWTCVNETPSQILCEGPEGAWNSFASGLLRVDVASRITELRARVNAGFRWGQWEVLTEVLTQVP
jgi:hypothetical protein